MGGIAAIFPQSLIRHSWQTMDLLALICGHSPHQANDMPCYHTYYAAVSITQRHVKGRRFERHQDEHPHCR